MQYVGTNVSFTNQTNKYINTLWKVYNTDRLYNHFFSMDELKPPV